MNQRQTLWGITLAVLPALVSCVSPIREEGRVPPLLRSNVIQAREEVQEVTQNPRSHEYAPVALGDNDVAYVSDARGQLDIWYRSYHGGDQARFELVSTGYDEKAPFIGPGPDGNDVCMFVSNLSGKHQVYSGSPPRVRDQTLEFGPRGHANWPCLDSTGEQLLCSVNDGDDVYDIWVINLAEDTAALKFVGQRAHWNPVNPNRFVFVRESEGRWQIWFCDNETGKTKMLSSTEFDMFDPVYSPDGRHIAFTSNKTGSSDIWVMRNDGADPKPITEHGAIDCHPAWTQDGGSLLFASDRAGTFDIYRVSMEDILNDAPPQG